MEEVAHPNGVPGRQSTNALHALLPSPRLLIASSRCAQIAAGRGDLV